MSPIAAALLLVLPVQDSRIDWRDAEAYERCLGEASESGRPLLLYFKMKWCAPSRQLDRSAFSDDRVVSASRAFVCVRIDYESDAGKALFKTWDVQGTPTVLLLGPDGKMAHNLGAGADKSTADVCVQQFGRIAARFGRAPRWEPSLEEALARGRAESRSVIAFWTDGREKAEELELSLGHEVLAKVRQRSLWVRLKLTRKSEAAARFKVSTAPCILELDPLDADPAAKPLCRIDGFHDPVTLERQLGASPLPGGD